MDIFPVDSPEDAGFFSCVIFSAQFSWAEAGCKRKRETEGSILVHEAFHRYSTEFLQPSCFICQQCRGQDGVPYGCPETEQLYYGIYIIFIAAPDMITTKYTVQRFPGIRGRKTCRVHSLLLCRSNADIAFRQVFFISGSHVVLCLFVTTFAVIRTG